MRKLLALSLLIGATGPAVASTAPAYGYSEPAWMTFCGTMWTRRVVCTEETYAAGLDWKNPLTPAAYPLPAWKSGNWGATPAAVTAGFPANLAQVVAHNAGLATQLARVTPLLGLLSTELLAYDHAGYTGDVLRVFAAHATTGAQLRLYESAFGTALITPALPYASAAVQAQFHALPKSAPLLCSAAFWTAQGKVSPSTNADMSYLQEVILLQFFSGTDDGPTSLVKASHYAQGVLTHGAAMNVFYALPPAAPKVPGSAGGATPDALPMPGPVVSWAMLIVGAVQAFNEACPTCGEAIANAITDWMHDTVDAISNPGVWVPTPQAGLGVGIQPAFDESTDVYDWDGDGLGGGGDGGDVTYDVE